MAERRNIAETNEKKMMLTLNFIGTSVASVSKWVKRTFTLWKMYAKKAKVLKLRDDNTCSKPASAAHQQANDLKVLNGAAEDGIAKSLSQVHAAKGSHPRNGMTESVDIDVNGLLDPIFQCRELDHLHDLYSYDYTSHWRSPRGTRQRQQRQQQQPLQRRVGSGWKTDYRTSSHRRGPGLREPSPLPWLSPRPKTTASKALSA
eukprot:gnl/TRDRNA2_/TRDRNA2_166305_c1_seq7.p1 gnl/TRDRNA2_/TRDRNA2_166305_c1~~gnl/TRDRNA2_/TRDRNA2_166305_c1_seq7.p1  ORF type:complete len:203 (+),score=22.95 gnl/TRDRNA2_/TRDRNA2_166305_c1_seq7:2-610(+)